MSTTVFICWSGARSHAIAKAVEELLKNMKVQEVFVSDHIDKGAAWRNSILDELRDAKVGIVCLTSENLESPWMHFEAGALAAHEQSAPSPPGDVRLFTVLHGVTAAEINGPLSAYQASSTTRQEMDQLVRQIKSILDEQSAQKSNSTHEGIPDETWNGFKTALEQATVSISELISDLGQTLQRKTFNEPLHRCADQAWLARYEGARLTREKLLPRLNQVRAACPPHERELFELLLTELDGYAMALQAHLLRPAEFKLGDTGELQMFAGIQTCCEDRRLAIRSIATSLLHPVDDPLTDEAVRFMAAETNEERKMIVHRLEARIRQEWEEAHEDAQKNRKQTSATDHAALEHLVAKMLERHRRLGPGADKKESDQPSTTGADKKESDQPSPLRLLRFRESGWDLDRIYYYLLVHYFGTAALRWESSQKADHTAKTEKHDLPCAIRDVELEVERYRARSKGGSLLPLTYGLMALRTLCSIAEAEERREEDHALKSAFTLVKEELANELRKPDGRPIERLLALRDSTLEGTQD